MFNLLKRKVNKKAQKQIETQINDLQLYLENNYKDLAIEARQEAIMLIEGCYERGELDNKSYTKYKSILSEYSKKMENYNHQQFYSSSSH
ncbi:hypothetical protein [Cellulosilyticum lentocellum]|uniref:Uncharacterized protein n=1 Tax=Cellulosilyticum lentocellum (strain ATCC 49066 / DSM 5427 / NCIMB 11756 / RHM5) TaxID=642492 RepID=F2JJA0_CELLD|nr:hypothetical protein [Cellulosilyticum lentocellum]ADZ84393.1 hypothetical protein Clole_2692 [Cellulosilyticum lentocellum DSM 5427]